MCIALEMTSNCVIDLICAYWHDPFEQGLRQFEKTHHQTHGHVQIMARTSVQHNFYHL